MATNSSPVPQIFDTTKRTLRTLIQAGIPAFTAFAGVLPLVLAQLGHAVPPKVEAVLVAFAGGVTVTAAAIARIMAIPQVNAFLAQIGLGGHSGTLTASDTYTRALLLPAAASTD